MVKFATLCSIILQWAFSHANIKHFIYIHFNLRPHKKCGTVSACIFCIVNFANITPNIFYLHKLTVKAVKRQQSLFFAISIIQYQLFPSIKSKENDWIKLRIAIAFWIGNNWIKLKIILGMMIITEFIRFKLKANAVKYSEETCWIN